MLKHPVMMTASVLLIAAVLTCVRCRIHMAVAPTAIEQRSRVLCNKTQKSMSLKLFMNT